MRFPRKCGVKKRRRAGDEHLLQDGTEGKPLRGNRETCAREMGANTKRSLVRRGVYGKGFRDPKQVAASEASTEGTPE